MTVEYREEDLMAVWDEFQPLFRANYEAAKDYDDLKFEMDRDHYANLCAAGIMRFYAMRLDGAAIGYAAFIVATSPHLATVPHAFHDAFYVAPNGRQFNWTGRLLHFTEAKLADLGVRIVYQHVKSSSDRHARWLEIEGYEVSEIVYAKRLDKE